MATSRASAPAAGGAAAPATRTTTPADRPPGAPQRLVARVRARVRAQVRARVRLTAQAVARTATGLGTAAAALGVLLLLLVVGLLCLVGVGLPLLRPTLRSVRAVGDLERSRLSRQGPEVIDPGPVPAGLRAATADPTVRRELYWLPVHATVGLAIGLVGVSMPVNIVRDGTFPLWWRLLPSGEATGSLPWWMVHDRRDALLVALVAPVWLLLTVALSPMLARLQAAPGRRLLAPAPDADLALRVTQLTATRAAALDAHATELRRIERSLHDGSQNRLVAVTVLVGAARRALVRSPADADAALERAQDAAEQALADLRSVVRSILPPVLDGRSLADALSGLAATSPIPCEVDADVSVRCAASVEATAYFVVAEALTNVARHSRARRAVVAVRLAGDRLHLQISDDGVGGADQDSGSGIIGIRRRVEAHDGMLTVSSPPGGPTMIEVGLPCGS